jgi:hypothetical protein
MSPGAVISPTSPPTRAGCIWRRSSTWPPATCSAGRWTTATTLAWSLAPWRRPPLPVVVTGWTARSSTPTAAANTPRPPASTSASGWGCGGPWAALAPAWIRRRRVVLRHPQGRAGRPLPLPHPRAGARLDLPLDRLVQPPSASLHQRLPTAAGVGTAAPSCPPATVNPGRIATVSGQRGEVHFRGVLRGGQRPESAYLHSVTDWRTRVAPCRNTTSRARCRCGMARSGAARVPQHCGTC